MFSYLGSKSKLAHLYPAPRYDRIIEPFAGSARYALRYFDREVILFDDSPMIVRLWEYLIAASEKDILGLPDIESKRSLDEIESLTPVERDLIGFHLCRGKAKPRKVGHGQNSWNQDKKRIAADVWKVKHWKVARLAFGPVLTVCPPATWFIDGPYQHTQIRSNGDRYPVGDGLDYMEMGSIIRQLEGQVIVCEGADADWLPFTLLREVSANTNGHNTKKYKELVWMNS
jgi:hypothetical protein